MFVKFWFFHRDLCLSIFNSSGKQKYFFECHVIHMYLLIFHVHVMFNFLFISLFGDSTVTFLLLFCQKYTSLYDA